MIYASIVWNVTDKWNTLISFETQGIYSLLTKLFNVTGLTYGQPKIGRIFSTFSLQTIASENRLHGYYSIQRFQIQAVLMHNLFFSTSCENSEKNLFSVVYNNYIITVLICFVFQLASPIQTVHTYLSINYRAEHYFRYVQIFSY